MSAKPPTPQAISRLLREAGFTRSETHGKGSLRGVVCTEGYHVQADITEPGVLVRWWCAPDAIPSLADNRAVLVRYAEVIERAGWLAEMRRHELVVTAKESAHPLTAT